ncbi:conserved membrane hypothetical protein [Cupriavidus taiwanensis]|uniref:Uncharacterized protein n=1 Tax=Cupriavidus taiwanensis TaxID=164546 RepID=A0A375BKR8_9BURK|nr:hypothetical protein [Cupriavidus taiwanensis]SOY46850.1 conserved membrane hypothetical protein [Cupriavidus taiwanensis]
MQAIAIPESDRSSAGNPAISNIVVYCVISMLILLMTVMAVAVVGAPAIMALGMLALLISAFVPGLGLVLLLSSITLQNLVLALGLDLIESPDTFKTFQSASFIITTAIFSHALAYLFLRQRTLSRPLRSALFAAAVFGFVIGVYTIIGMRASTLLSAGSYARLYFLGGMSLVIGVVACRRTSKQFRSALFFVTTVLLCGYGVIEFLFPEYLYNLVSADAFQRMKFADTATAGQFSSIQDLVRNSTRSYLNLSGQYGLDLAFLRIMGPNFHAISYAYALSFLALIEYAERRFLTFLIAAALVLLIGAKGPLIIITLSIATLFIARRGRRSRLSRFTLIAMLLIYAVVGVSYGVKSADYHILGFLAGVQGFKEKPLGRGVGVGGNLSELGKSNEKDFTEFQHQGVASFALESGLGVLLYQIGMFTVLLFWFLFKVIRLLRKHVDPSNFRIRTITASAVATLLITGIFQEEVFSPAAWGLWMLLSGILVGNLSPGLSNKPTKWEYSR